MMARNLRFLWSIVAVCAVATGTARAQVSVPNIKGPINAAKKAAEKTNDQTRAAEKVGDAPAQQKSAQAPQTAAPAPQKAGSSATPNAASKAAAKAAPRDSVSTPQPGARRGTVVVYREVYSYSAAGRRDPFVSLMLSGELRPVITDLILTGVVYDPNGVRSNALLVDVSTGESYSVRNGTALARMKVTRIGMESITFSIDEFGLSRSETLIIDKTRKGPVATPRRP